MSKNPLNIDSQNSEETIHSINEYIKLALKTKESDMPLALNYAKKAVRHSLNIPSEEDFDAVLCKNSAEPVSSQKEFADAIHTLAECEFENSNFDKAIFYLRKAEKLYDELKDKKGSCEVCISFGKIYVQKGEFQTAINYNLQALKISEEIKDVKRMMGIMNNIGFNYWNLGDNTKAFDYLSRSLDYKRQFGGGLDIARNLNNLGLVYNAMGDFASALQCYKEACSIVEDLKEKKGVAIIYMNIGLLYVKLYDMEKASMYLNKSLEINLELGYKKGLGENYINMALLNRRIKNYDEALRFAYKSYEIANEIGDKKVIAFSYQEIFKVLAEKEDYKTALEYAWKCYNLRKEIDHRAGVVEICHILCELFLEMDELDKVLELAEEAFSICEEAQMKQDKIGIHLIFAKYYEKTGDYKKSALNYKLHNDLRNDFFSEEARNKVGNLQAIFEIEQARKESEIYKLKNIDLAEANKKLEDMNQEKNEFLNLVSHDLKNPLHSIYGFSNILVEDISTLSTEEVVDFATNINIGSMAMLDLVNEILNSDLMESGRYELTNELIDLNILVKSLIAMNKFQLKQKGIKIFFDDKIIAHVFSDINVVKQILSNLVSNAIKFSPEGKNIYINIVHDKVDSSTSVEVKDEGPGISEEDKLKLFTKFGKLSAKPTAGESSTGLGLSIVQKLCAIIGSKILCKSEIGRGANFILHIPTTPLKTKK